MRCHAFITECTFGLPVFTWLDQAEVLRAEINAWWAANAAAGRASILGAYALGKAQRLLACVDPAIGPILTHGAVENTNEVLRAQGYRPARHDPCHARLDRRRTIPARWSSPRPRRSARPGHGASAPPRPAFASGWMALRGVRRRRAADRGFVVSDHADWDGLNAAIRETGAEKDLRHPWLHRDLRRWLAARP